MGSVKQLGETVEVQDDFELLCWDLVSVPSTPGPTMVTSLPLTKPLHCQQQQQQQPKSQQQQHRQQPPHHLQQGYHPDNFNKQFETGSIIRFKL